MGMDKDKNLRYLCAVDSTQSGCGEREVQKGRQKINRKKRCQRPERSFESRQQAAMYI